MDGLNVTVYSHPAKPVLSLNGRFPVSPLAIDVRLQSARWMNDFENAGGRLIIEKVSALQIDELSRKNDLTIVATGKDGGAFFARDAARSPRTAPLRQLAMVNCEGPSMRFADVPFSSAKFNVFEGLGKSYWTPYFHKDGKQISNLVFEAKLGTPYDRFQSACSGHDVLRIGKEIIREMMPWDYASIENATLADENSWLVGAITPVVRDPVGKTANGRPIVPFGDAYLASIRLALKARTWAIAWPSRWLPPSLSVRMVRSILTGFVKRTMRFTHAGARPRCAGLSCCSHQGAAARYFFLAQLGADGSTVRHIQTTVGRRIRQ